MYLSKLSELRNVFVVSFDRLSVWWNQLAWSQQPFDPITKCICPTTEIYFSKYENVFVKNAKCICLDWEMYLLIDWACGRIDWCGRGNLSILVTPLTPPCSSALQETARLLPITDAAVQCKPVQLPIPITRQFSRRGKMMSGGLSIRWQLAGLPHHIWGCALPFSSYLILPHFLPTTTVKFLDTAGKTYLSCWHLGHIRPVCNYLKCWAIFAQFVTFDILGHFGPLTLVLKCIQEGKHHQFGSRLYWRPVALLPMETVGFHKVISTRGDAVNGCKRL